MRTITTAAAVALLLGGSVASGAGCHGSRSASFLVSVTVIAHTELEVVSGPSRLTVTESDVARGFVFVPDVSRVRVRSTARDGYLLHFRVAPGPGWRLTVSGLGDQVVAYAGMQFGLDHATDLGE